MVEELRAVGLLGGPRFADAMLSVPATSSPRPQGGSAPDRGAGPGRPIHRQADPAAWWGRGLQRRVDHRPARRRGCGGGRGARHPDQFPVRPWHRRGVSPEDGEGGWRQAAARTVAARCRSLLDDVDVHAVVIDQQQRHEHGLGYPKLLGEVDE